MCADLYEIKHDGFPILALRDATVVLITATAATSDSDAKPRLSTRMAGRASCLRGAGSQFFGTSALGILMPIWR